MPPILVIGATGTIGRHVVGQLLGAGVPVRAAVRDPQASGLPSQLEAFPADLTHPESLEPALNGTETVFLVWAAPPDSVPAALDRITRRARRIVFLTSPHKTPHPFFQQPNPVRNLHAQIEHLIQSSGVEWTFLRPGMFAANALLWWAPQIRAGDLVRWPYLAAPTAPIDERDVAAVAVRALRDASHSGADYVLTGPESLTQFEQLSLIARAIQRPLRLEEIPPGEARLDWQPAWPASIRNMLLDAWCAGLGHQAFVTSTFRDLMATPPRTFLQWAIDHASYFRA